MSFAVEHPKIAEVMDMRTGQVVAAETAIGDVYEFAVRLRNDVKERLLERRPLYTCPLCGVGLQLNGMVATKRFHFRHIHEMGNCPINTRSELTREQVDAIRYNGAKESELHFKMKHWIAQCIEADGAFATPRIETGWKGALNGDLRRPDVQSVYNGVRVAFEVQLSSTYLDVIVGRRQFYRQEGGLLFWVFAEFDEGMRKLTQDDVFFNNNQNAFCVTPATVQASLERGKFMLECIWRVPLSASDPSLVSDLQRRLVRFDELTLDVASQKAYFFDFHGSREALAAQEHAQPRKLVEPEEQPWWYTTDEAERLRERFKGTWLRAIAGRVPAEEWEELVFRFEEIDLTLPPYPHWLPETVLRVLYSLKEGRPVGYRFEHLIQVLHETLPRKNRRLVMPYLEYVWEALVAYKRLPELRKAGNYAAWKAKVAEHKALVGERVVQPAPEQGTVRVIEFLFPELAAATPRLSDAL